LRNDQVPQFKLTHYPESALLRTMFDVGYFPPNTPPGEHRDGQRQKAAR
jgi:hypothetical protein